MRAFTVNQLALETKREREIGWLFHIFAERDTGVVTLPDGWGSWCYSNGFTGNVAFTDVADYAGDGVQSRTYQPAGVEPESDALAAIQDSSLDARSVKIVFDANLDPFLNYCDGRWPLRFGIVIYKIARNGDALALADGAPLAQIRFVGYLKAAQFTAKTAGKKLEVEWASLHDVFARQVPVPTFSLYCPKKLYSTGKAMLACNADKPSKQVVGTVVSINNDLVRAAEWGGFPNGWFAGGVFEYTAVDPVSGLTFGFALDAISDTEVTSGGINYHDVLLSPSPILLLVGQTISGYAGCDRTRNTCMTRHKPAGVSQPQGTATGEIDFVVVMPYGGSITLVGNSLTVSATAPPLPGPAVAIEINGNDYDPTSGPYTLDPPMPASTATVSVENIVGEGVVVAQQPASGNSFTTIIGIPNNMTKFRFNLFWQTGTVPWFGNLQNFGGAPDMPVENPAFEITQ